MKRFFLLIIGCAVLAMPLAANLGVSFDDIPLSNPLPKGYGGIAWTGGWFNLNAAPPYAAHSGTRIAAPIYKGSGSGFEGGERQFELQHGEMGYPGSTMGQGFLGLWIVGAGTVNGKPQTARLKVYDGPDYLPTEPVTLIPNKPVWIFSTYTGSITKVGIEVNAGIKFFAIDDVTLISDGTWKKAPEAPFIQGAAMAYDQKRRETVLFGSGETWTWDGARWTRKNPARSPGMSTGSSAMTYDSVRGVVVLFGGETDNGTWTWDGRNWTQKWPATVPRGRIDAAMAFDSSRGVAVLFGANCGYSGDSLNDTWIWNGTNWIQKFPKTKPVSRCKHSMAYDPIRKQVVLFGGFYIDENGDASGADDMWIWDGSNWTEQPRNGAWPWARLGHGMAWDGGSGGLLLFGGTNRYAVESFDDTWIWNGKVWRLQPRRGSPPNLGDYGIPVSMAWDVYRKEVIMSSQFEAWIWKGHPPRTPPVAAGTP